MAAFQLQLGKQSKVGMVGYDSHVVFGLKFPDEKGSVRRCVVVMKQPVLSLPEFEVKSLHVFMQSQEKVTAVCRIDCLAL
jgi:hypothetical protein